MPQYIIGEVSGSGDMTQSVYDPTGIYSSAFLPANFPFSDSAFNALNVDTVLQEIGETSFWNGFDRVTPTSMGTITWTDGTRTVEINKGSEANYYFWCRGKKITNTAAKSVAVPATTGTYYIYLDDSGDLQYILQASLTTDIFYNLALVAVVYWNNTAGVGKCGDERHGIRMSAMTHFYEHQTDGAKFAYGMDVTGLTDGSGTYTNTTSGSYFDEDIWHQLLLQTTHEFMYRLGAAGEWTYITADNKVAYNGGSGDYYWNEETGGAWQLTRMGSSTDYAIMFLVATNDIDTTTVYKLMGQNAYATRNAARNAIEDEINTLILDGLPNAEFVFLHAYIYRQNGVLEDLADGSTHVDLRKLKGGTPATSNPSPQGDEVTLDTTNFDNNLSATDVDVQTAMETLDDMSGGGNPKLAIEATGADAIATGTSAIAIGAGTNATSADAIEIGNSAHSGASSVAIGKDSSAGNAQSVAIGFDANDGGGGSVAIGWSSEASINGIGIGRSADAEGGSATALGYLALGGDSYGVAIGGKADAETGYTVALGPYTQGGPGYSLALGSYSSAERYSEQWVGANNATAANSYGRGEMTLRAETTDATETEIFSRGVASNRLTLQANSSLTFEAIITAYNSTDGIAAGYIRRGIIRRDGSDSTVLVGTVDDEMTKEEGAMSACDISIEADDTNEALIAKVTGLAGKTIRWAVTFKYTEVRA